MSDSRNHVERAAEAVSKVIYRVPWRHLGPQSREQCRLAAQAAIDALGLTEEWAVSSGERRQFERHGSRDRAERALFVAESNNVHWERNGREIPLWARNPRIESRLVSFWREEPTQ